jgi:predicted dehydrogenase
MSQERVRLGVAGVGGWGKFVARNFSSTAHCQLAAVCDANRTTLNQQSRLYPEAALTDCFDDLLRDPALDAIALATPAPAHYEMAKAALSAGKHVFVEKPMTLSTEHAHELVELADAVDRKLMVGHLLEYHPAVDLMKQQVDAGELGDIHYMYCQRLNLGVVRQQENAFWSLAPHDISVILYLFGAEPNHIDATGQSFLQNDIEDLAFATLHFADGRMANIHVSWLDPHKKRSMVVVGSEKMLVFDDMQSTEKIRIFDKSACIDAAPTSSLNPIVVRHGDIRIPKIGNHEPLAIETEHFINCILQDTTPRSDGRDGLRVVRVLEAVHKQFRQQAPLPLRKAA